MSKRIYELLHKSDTERISERGFRTRILISLFSIMICMAVMLSSAYSWFIMDVSSNKNELRSANYSLEIVDENGVGVAQTENGHYVHKCELVFEDNHNFTLTASGTATKGYCQIRVTGSADGGERTVTYTTELIGKDNRSLDVCIQAAEGCTIEFIPVWGAYEAQKVYSLRRSPVFMIQHSTTPHIEYLVVEGVTLEALADYYSVSAEDICIYNDITDLTVGETIKIPGIEDDSLEPYMPITEVATPTNATLVETATPSDADKEAVMTPSNAENGETMTSSDSETAEKTMPSDAANTEVGISPDYANTDGTSAEIESEERDSVGDAMVETIEEGAYAVVASDSNALISQ